MNRTLFKVGLGSCGVAAGAQKVYDRLQQLSHDYPLLVLEKTNCIGMCFCEPLVLVEMDESSVIYGNVSVDIIDQIVESHLVKHQLFKESFHMEALTNSYLNQQVRWALRNCGVINPEKIEDYEQSGGYQAIHKIKDWSPEQIINEINLSGLRGRGGGGLPTGAKWQLAAKQPLFHRYIVCNADEGDPGAFMDRSILEGDPHGVIEGMIILGRAIGASMGIIYCRAEYPLAIKRMNLALEQARQRGYLSLNHFDIYIKEGAGAFVCGEETALIASIEGRRGMPQKRPPYPVEHGLWGQPTVINNVETFVTIPAIILQGAQKYAALGTHHAKGTKVFAVTGKINRSGLVEVPMGTPLSSVIFDICGGAPDGRKIKAVQIGGPSGGSIPASLFHTLIDYDTLIEAGAMMGSGGMVVLDERTCMVDLAKFFLNFTQKESCGKCTFCRIGTLRLLEILEKITKGEGQMEDLDRLEDLANEIKINSLCGLGQSAPNPVLSTLRHFRSEYEAHIVEKRCLAVQCEALIRYEVIPEKCIGCLLCKKKCPTNAITGDLKKPHLIHMLDCIRCGACFNTCKHNAIRKC